MSLYENWIKLAYDSKGNAVKKTWDLYMPIEQKIYENMLQNKIDKFTGTVNELGIKLSFSNEYLCGFLDGISDALKVPLDIKSLTPETSLNLEIDFEKLYKKMVEYEAAHLYKLTQWDNIFTEEQRKIMYIEQKKSRTVINVQKIGRNEPCICGSGKKYKYCCGNV